MKIKKVIGQQLVARNGPKGLSYFYYYYYYYWLYTTTNDSFFAFFLLFFNTSLG